MSEYCTFDYAVLRLVPRVELEEFFNVGVIVSCPTFKFLESRTRVNEGKLKCFAPDLPLATVEEYLSIVPRICSGDPEAGPIAGLTQRERFYWLTAQRSTIIQSSPVHTGLTEDPKDTIEQLFRRYVR
jgi:hypothetical protein